MCLFVKFAVGKIVWGLKFQGSKHVPGACLIWVLKFRVNDIILCLKIWAENMFYPNNTCTITIY